MAYTLPVASTYCKLAPPRVCPTRARSGRAPGSRRVACSRASMYCSPSVYAHCAANVSVPAGASVEDTLAAASSRHESSELTLAKLAKPAWPP